MNAIPSAHFYITGGTVPRDAACYVARQADLDLQEGLRQGQFCYVLTARQMGKSSLMVRTATKLRQEGVTCVILDLTSIGQNLDAERWYGGLLNQLGQQVNLEDELDDAWLAPSSLGPMQKWMKCLQQVVLKGRAGKLIIFVDEIDAVRSLPFSADEFFAGIRECYNRRTEDPDFQRLAFCLLGVATPADLIRDPRTTPFNIGKRIELTDFTEAEAAPLGAGLSYPLDGERVLLQLSESEALLKRVLYWTGGHPYLTQRLCSALATHVTAPSDQLLAPSVSSGITPTPAIVDRLCSELFLDSSARERDDNLLFVRERLLRSEVDIAGLLLLYRQVWEGRRVPVDETNALISLLRLSGITRVAKGLLKPRNRIYATVFDRRWVAANLPDAEVKRQRAAYNRGVVRATGVFTALIVIITTLAAFAFRMTSQAYSLGALVHRLLFIRDMDLIQTDYDSGRFDRIPELLAEAKAIGGSRFEWGYWNRRYHKEILQPAAHSRPLGPAGIAPDGLRADQYGALAKEAAILLSAGRDASAGTSYAADDPYAMSLVKEASGSQITSERPNLSSQYISGQPDQSGRIISLPLFGNTFPGISITMSADRKRLAAATFWLCEHGRQPSSTYDQRTGMVFGPHNSGGRVDNLRAIAFARYEYVATIEGRGEITIWSRSTGAKKVTLNEHSAMINDLAFSPNGLAIVTGSQDGTVKVWDAETGRETLTIRAHSAPVEFVGFSPDRRGEYLVTKGRDAIIVFDSRDPAAGPDRRGSAPQRSRAEPVSPDTRAPANPEYGMRTASKSPAQGAGGGRRNASTSAPAGYRFYKASKPVQQWRQYWHLQSTGAAVWPAAPSPAPVKGGAPWTGSSDAPTRFSFYNAAQPVEPGWRYWRRQSNTTWIERYPSGRETVFSVAGPANVSGDNGTLLLRQPDKKLYVFVPDKGGRSAYAMFMQPGGNWTALGAMVDVR